MIIEQQLSSKWGDYKINIHQDCLPDLLTLIRLAKSYGFSPRIISAYRSYDHQLRIWNDKLLSKRACMDFLGNTILNTQSFTIEEKIFSIARWSSFPGFSRHHWGTDIDIIDENSFPKLSDCQLIPQESYPNQPNYRFHHWLYYQLKEINPYLEITFPYFNGDFTFSPDNPTPGTMVGPEAWHLSFHHVSKNFEKHSLSKEYWEKQVAHYFQKGIFSYSVKIISEQLYNFYTSSCL